MERKKVLSEPAAVRVGFSINPEKNVTVENDRKKYLTAKYGQHQMALIKKRLNVELWLIDQLSLLYPKAASVTPLECDIDLDDLLDLERDEERRKFLKIKLADCPQSALIVGRFIEDVLVKAKSL